MSACVDLPVCAHVLPSLHKFLVRQVVRTLGSIHPASLISANWPTSNVAAVASGVAYAIEAVWKKRKRTESVSQAGGRAGRQAVSQPVS